MEVILGNEFLHSKSIPNCMVLLLFTSCKYPPNQALIPLLKSVYTKSNESSKVFEVIQISLDDNYSQFVSSTSDLPWLMIPFQRQQRISRILSFYSITHAPSLVLIDKSGNPVLSTCLSDLYRLEENAVEFWSLYLSKTLELSLSKGFKSYNLNPK